MFRNMKLGVRIGLGFALVLALGIGTVLFTITQLSHVEGSIETVVHDRNVKTRQANDILTYVGEAETAARNLLLVSDPAVIDRENAKIDGLSNKATALIDTLNATIINEEGKRLLATYATVREEYVRELSQVRSYAALGNRSEAVKLLMEDMTVAQEAYSGAVEALISHQTRLAESDGIAAQDEAAKARTWGIGLLIAMVLLSIATAWFTARLLTTALGRCVSIADDLAAGDLDQSIEVTSGDEVGQLMASMKQLVERLRGLIADMNEMSHQHDVGDIDAAIPAESTRARSGRWPTGVNKMVQGHITVKKKAMACVAAFGKGDFDAELERFPGKKAFINDTIEMVRANLKKLNSELRDLITASKGGELSRRADAKAFEGDWGELVGGVNEILDAVLEPIGEAQDVLERVAERDMTARVEGDYKGDHARIKEAVNRPCRTWTRRWGRWRARRTRWRARRTRSARARRRWRRGRRSRRARWRRCRAVCRS